MSAMNSPFVKYPVAVVVGCCLLGVSPLGASVAKTVVDAYGTTAGIVIGVAPTLPDSFDEGRKLTEQSGSTTKS